MCGEDGRAGVASASQVALSCAPASSFGCFRRIFHGQDRGSEPPSPASAQRRYRRDKSGSPCIARRSRSARPSSARYDLFLQNLVKGTSHLSLGQEAVAAGFAAAMQPGDLSFCTYRGHAHTLARGVPVDQGFGRADAARYRADARQRRLDAPDLGRPRRHGLLRHHRRASADRLRRRLARAVQGRQGRFGLLLRRRHHQYRRLPRSAELRSGVEAAGHLRRAKTICTWNTRRSPT